MKILTAIGIFYLILIILAIGGVVYKYVWTKSIWPFIDKMIYRGMLLEGEWDTTCHVEEDKERMECKEKATIEQFGHIVRGVIRYKENTKAETEEYEFEGRFEDQLLIARYGGIKDKTSSERGVFALTANQEGTALEGFMIFYSAVDERVLSSRYTWSKVQV